jgi:hypothetical protein
VQYVIACCIVYISCIVIILILYTSIYTYFKNILNIEAQLAKLYAYRKVSGCKNICSREFCCLYLVPPRERVYLVSEINKDLNGLRGKDKKQFVLDQVKSCVTGISSKGYVKVDWTLGKLLHARCYDFNE